MRLRLRKSEKPIIYPVGCIGRCGPVAWIAASDIGYLLASRSFTDAIHVVEATYGENCLNQFASNVRVEDRQDPLRVGLQQRTYFAGCLPR